MLFRSYPAGKPIPFLSPPPSTAAWPGGPRAFPPACLPYVFPQFSDLWGPRSATREEVVARLPLATVAPPVLIRMDLVVEIGPYRCVARLELVVAVIHRLSRATELLMPETLSRGGLVYGFLWQ